MEAEQDAIFRNIPNLRRIERQYVIRDGER